MSDDVFVSYKREDERRVGVLVDGLRRAGLNVWWDREIGGGQKWRDHITEQLVAAKCVVVAWSEAATGATADFVRDEASRAMRSGKLLQLRIDDVALPLGFGEHQAIDLIGWDGQADDARFQYVVSAVRAVMERKPMPIPPPIRRRRVVWTASTVALFVMGAGLLLGLPAGQRAICTVPGVRGVCGEMGWGGVASRAEEALWASRRAGDCDVLRRIITQFPKGVYAEEARRRLGAAQPGTKERWEDGERRIPMTVQPKLQPFASEAEAQRDALARAAKEAETECGFWNQGEFRVVAAKAVLREWRCMQRLGGHACSFEGEAVCAVKVRKVDQVEACP